MADLGDGVMITGAEGQLGRALQQVLQREARTIPVGRAECDLGVPESIRSAVTTIHPGIIVNCAAYTNVEAAEEDPGGARRVNALGAEELASVAARAGAWLIHLSTDYVFDGATSTPYSESDVTAPINAYGRSKAEGERRVLAVAPDALVIRSSWLYGGRSRNFFATITRLAGERDTIQVVADQVGSPTSVDALAIGLTALITRQATERPFGIMHLASGGVASWYELATVIVAAMPTAIRRPGCRVEAITSDQWPAKAQRPRFSALASDRAEREYGLILPSWQDQVASVSARWWA